MGQEDIHGANSVDYLMNQLGPESTVTPNP